MKIIIRLAFMSLIVLSFFISITRFETHLFNKYSNYFEPLKINKENEHSSDNLSYRYLVINFNDIKINEKEFILDFTKGLDLYKLNAYQGYQDNKGLVLFAYSNDNNYINNLYLINQEIDSLTNFESIKTNSTENNLFLPLNLKKIQIFSFYNLNHPQRNIQSSYILTVNKENTEDLVSSIYNLNQFLTTKYKGISFEVREVNMTQLIENRIERTDYYLYFIVCMLIMLLINIETLSKSKRISILKTEGYSTFDIFKNIYFNKTIEYLLFLIIIQTFLLLVFIKIPISKALFLIETILLLDLISFIFLMILGTYVYYSISVIPVNMSIKGKSSLNTLLIPSSILKIISIIITVPLILTGFSSTFEIVNSQIHENEYLELISDRYITMYVRSEYSGKAMNSQDLIQNEKMREELIKTNQLLYVQKSAEGINIYDEQNNNVLLPNFYYVSENYLKRYNLNYDLDTSLIIYCRNDCLESAKLIALYHQIDISLTKIYEINSDIIFENFENSSIYPINQFLSQDSILVFLPNYTKTLSSIDSFTFKGNIDQAQLYLDTLSASYNIPSKFRLVSFKDLYYEEKNININNLLINIFYLIFIIFHYSCLVLNQSSLFKNIYERKLMLMKIEGYSNFEIIIFKLKRFILPLIFMEICILIIYPITILQIIQLLIFIVTIEIIINYFYNKKGEV